MGIESRDWYREEPPKRRLGFAWLIAWLIGALVLGAVVFAATSQGRRALGIDGRPAQPGASSTLRLGGPPLAIDRAGLYPASDPWRRYLADEQTCPGAERTDLPLDRQAQVMLCLIDWARQRAGLTLLPQTVLLASTSLQKANEIVRCQNFAHAACGDDPDADVRTAGYRGTFGENLYVAGGRLGAPRVALDGWLNSPGHRENLFRPEWRTQGIALIKLDRFGPYRNALLWVSHFASE